MSRESSKGERADASSEGRPRPSAERAVQARLEKIQREKRSGVRWKLSRHTAEQAMMAISDVAPRPEHRASSKSRRRKRYKRLL
jgi:hypothetical protein